MFPKEPGNSWRWARDGCNLPALLRKREHGTHFQKRCFGGFGLPGIVEAANRNPPADEGAGKPKRFEEMGDSLQKSKAAGWPGYSGQVTEASAEKGRKL